ncbi:hypothetical protein ACVXHA_05585 [Escherichia coli]
MPLRLSAAVMTTAAMSVNQYLPTPPRDDEKKVGIPDHYWRQYSLIS